MRSRKRPVMLWFLPVGFTGVLVQNALFSWHIAFFIEESPLKDSTVQTTCAVYRPVLKRVPLYAINVGCRHNSPKKPTKLLWFLATVIICAQFRLYKDKPVVLDSCQERHKPVPVALAMRIEKNNDLPRGIFGTHRSCSEKEKKTRMLEHSAFT